MPTRREVLLSLSAAPFTGVLGRRSPAAFVPAPEIIAEQHCLAQESARGFRVLLNRNTPLSREVIIVVGSRQLPRRTALQLRRRALDGAWLILESGLGFVRHEQAAAQVCVLHDVFGFRAKPPVEHAGGYIQYTWPVPRLLRDFNAITPVDCDPTERIARSQDVTAGAKRFLGHGCIIFLGSMLGPALLAEEREAHELGSSMLAGLHTLYPRSL